MVEQRDGDDAVLQIIPVSLRRVQCVGNNFLNCYKRLQGGIFNESVDSDGEGDGDPEQSGPIVFDDDVNYLRSLDPKEWKTQDHYAVLGIKWLRFKATEDTIKQAYRVKVLKHHPDKRKAAGEEVRQDDDYFTCISKAWEILGSKEKRRSYDSIDPMFDNDVPSVNDSNKANFFEVFGPVFDRNARWSEKKPVPKLGNLNTPREQVERFYAFWYNFESWREYSYLDEDEKDKGQDRDERRFIDKQNKAARAKLKKEEMTRVRNLVDVAYEIDPRIAKFRNDDKEKRLAFKRAKQEAAKAKQEEEDRLQREVIEKERKEKEAAEAEEKARQVELRKERENQKRQMKQKKKTLRDLCKQNNYYVENDNELVSHMMGLDTVCETLQLDQLCTLIENVNLKGREAFVQSIANVTKQIEAERLAQIQTAPKEKGETNSNKKGSSNWAHEHLQLLIKAVNLFPAGTNQRWEVVANFINQHASGGTANFTAKDVLAKAKDLQNDDFTRNILKDTANKKAFDNFEKDKKVAKSLEAVGDTTQTTERFDSPAEQQGLAPWTTAEQQLLEQALRTYGSTVKDRWDQVAACVPGRTKKDCMRRYKELAEMVKAKKAAQAAAAK